MTSPSPVSVAARLRQIPRVLASNPGDLASNNLGPNWFASVMGTGIIAVAAAGCPIIGPHLQGFAVAVWALACFLFVLLIVAVAVQWIRRPDIPRGHARDPVMAQFYGAPPMAILTIGTSTLLVGHLVVGDDMAVRIAWVCWFVGTITGLLTTVIIPYRLFTRYEVRPDAAFGGWLMPVVPPMVSATAGAFLVATMAPGTAQTTMLYACYAMFGMSLVASLIIITMIWSRLAHFGSSGTVRVPTLWVVLGPLGQSITAAGVLGTDAVTSAIEPPVSTSMDAMAVLYGVPVWGFALLWMCLAGALTVRTIRRKLPFALTWWSFTFPVGTMVTGTTQLAHHTGLPAFEVAAVVGFVGLLAAWLLVGIRTLNGALRSDLLRPKPAGGPVVSRKEPFAAPSPD